MGLTSMTVDDMIVFLTRLLIAVVIVALFWWIAIPMLFIQWLFGPKKLQDKAGM